MKVLIKTLLIFVLLTSVGLLVVGCDCGDDDDDNDDATPDDDDDNDDATPDDDDDTTPDDDDNDTAPEPLDLDEAIEVLFDEVINDAATGERWVAFFSSEALASGAALSSEEGDVWKTLTEAAFVGYVDDQPDALWAHDVRYTTIAEDDGAVDSLDENWPLMLDGDSIFNAEDAGDVEFVRLFSPTPMTDPVPDFDHVKDSPEADYGDAPDSSQAYPNGTAGGFPTLYDTPALLGQGGGHCLTVGEEMIGQIVSAEVDADDLSDPDGNPNLVDQDYDDGVWFRLNLTPTKATLQVIVEVTVDVGAPDVTRYINVLMDLDRNGEWNENTVVEWATINYEVNVPPGTSERIYLPPVELPLNPSNQFPISFWTRVALTRSEIDEDSYDSEGGWDGGGAFDYGEIEDHFLSFYPWTGPGGEPGDWPQPEPPAPPETEPPTPVTCDDVCTILGFDIPCEYKALVINGGDHPGQTHVDYAANAMKDFFSDYIGGGNVTYVDKPSESELEQAFEDFANSLRCYDRPFIYLIAHGAPEPYDPFFALYGSEGREKVTPQEMADMLDKINPCDPENVWLSECIEPVTNCRLTFIMESCHSGRFHGASSPLPKNGRNVITTSSADQPSYVSSKTSGGVFSMLWAQSLLDNGADDPDKVFDDAQDALDDLADDGQVNSQDAKISSNENCSCTCNPSLIDPVDDLIDLNTGDPVSTPVGWVDLEGLGIDWEGVVVIADLTMVADLPMPGAVLDFPFTMHFLIDADSDPLNNDLENPVLAGGDHVISYGWDMTFQEYILSVGAYDPELGWSELLVEAIPDIVDDTLMVVFNPADLGVASGDPMMISARVERLAETEHAYDETDYLGLPYQPSPPKCFCR